MDSPIRVGKQSAFVFAGVGTNDTAHSAQLARDAAAAGARGLLLVAPYYSKPTQEGLLAHVRAVADATELPIMLYDIPGRCGVAFAVETLLRLAEHPRVVAMKDAKGDLDAATRVQAATGMAWYSGDDGMTLAHVAHGGAGVVGVTTHVATRQVVALVDALDKGDLPAAVTLAFSPFSRDLDHWLTLARDAGHEVLLMVPMEPEAFPRDDPGPQALLVSLDAEQNRRRLEWLLARAAGYVGVINGMGSRFTATRMAMSPVLNQIHQRGLLFIDAATTPRSVAPPLAEEIGLPFAVSDRVIDDIAAPDAIDLRLRELEEIARERGVAVGLGSPYPVTRERLAEWAAGLERKGLVLAPVSAVAAFGTEAARRDG